MTNDETIMGSLQFSPVVAGFIGAIISMRAIADAKPLSRITSMLAASGAAGYLTPAIASIWDLSLNMQNAVGFLVGLLVLNLAAGLIELSRQFATNPVLAMQDLLTLVFKWRSGVPSAPQNTTVTHVSTEGDKQ